MSLADETLEKLRSGEPPGKTITKLFNSIFGTKYDAAIEIGINKLIKIYGWETVFYSVLDISLSDSFDFTRVIGLIGWYCKKRLDKEDNFVPKKLEPIAKKKVRIPEVCFD